MGNYVVASCTSSTLQLKSLSQHKVKPSSIQLIQKVDMSQTQQKWIVMRLDLFVQYMSRYDPYLIINIDSKYFPLLRHGHHPNTRSFSSWFRYARINHHDSSFLIWRFIGAQPMLCWIEQRKIKTYVGNILFSFIHSWHVSFPVCWWLHVQA